MSEEAPPSFSDSVASSEVSLPPGYEDSSRGQFTERVSTLETSKLQPWAFLKVKSRGGKSAGTVPRFIQGEPLTGTVELSLDKTEHIEAVIIQVHGEYMSVGQDPIRFLTTHETTLWSTAMGNPRSPKLKGKYAWPFTLTLPDTVIIPTVEKGPLTEHPLPPTFSERASPCYLDYKIVVTFRRGRLRIDQPLSMSFSYHPRSRPPPASPLRQLAYREDMPLLGPDVDHEGWEVLGPKSTVGTMFESRTVELACMFSLAKPLCYTRGTSIPFFLTLSCTDQQALDVFAGRGSLSIQLVRTLRTGADATDVNKTGRSDQKFVMTVGKGIYWPSGDDKPASETRKLIGEITVPGLLKPNFVFPRISVKYHVTLTITTPGFTVPSDDSGTGGPTFSQAVEIMTVLPPGPTPLSKVPVGYQKEFQSTNYDVTIGMLTGANQRFLHYHHNQMWG